MQRQKREHKHIKMARVFRKEHLKAEHCTEREFGNMQKTSLEYSADWCMHMKKLRERERTTQKDRRESCLITNRARNNTRFQDD